MGGWRGRAASKAEERKGKQGGGLLPAGLRLLPSLEAVTTMGPDSPAHPRAVPTDAPRRQTKTQIRASGGGRENPQASGVVSAPEERGLGLFCSLLFPRASYFTKSLSSQNFRFVYIETVPTSFSLKLCNNPCMKDTHRSASLGQHTTHWTELGGAQGGGAAWGACSWLARVNSKPASHMDGDRRHC